MVLTCDKCKKTFSTKYNLQRHLDKKVSCDKPLECNRCGKSFTKINTYQTHINRKFPCKNREMNQNAIDIKKLEMELKKLELISNTKIKLQEIKKETVDKLYDASIAKSNTQIKHDKAQIKIAEIKGKNALARQDKINETELIKERHRIANDDRKAMNKHIQKNTNVYINNLVIMDLENKYFPVNRQNMNNMKKLIEHSIEKVTIRPDDSEETAKKKTQNQEAIIALASKPEKVFDLIIRDTFMKNNKKYTFIFYNETNESYYAIYEYNSTKLIKVVNFESELSPIFKKVVNDILFVIYNVLKEFCIDNNIDLMTGNIDPEYMKVIDKTVCRQLASRANRFSLIQQIIMYNTITDNDIKESSNKIFKINCNNIENNQYAINSENKALKNGFFDDAEYDSDSSDLSI